ncbi:hypothetical protein [Actinoplanes siamensis]|uniref:Uncharacterized protein n=1 Tax=Actinoplanes siamensis TaxID=1223317 RepID=A0A919NDA4_9ACTN|nr:hypothetical protein [Actinoplanes siamensis]GIF08717.1 hypothetical protein Asi03nite_62550 [Actinoplanes siamensis]
MIAQRQPSEHAGKTVTIRADVAHLGGQEYRVEDWWTNITGGSWMDATGNPAALQYAARWACADLPTDNDVLYGKTSDGLGHLVHVSEIEVPS